jgi:hypothetical protein
VPAVVVAVGGVIAGTSWSHAEALSAVNPHGDRALSAKAQPYDVQLVAPVQGGLVGWCMTYDTPHRSGGKCPVVPTAARPIVAESWSSSSAPAVTEVVALTTGQVTSMSLPGAQSPVLTRAQPGLPYGLRAAFIEVPGQQPAGAPHPALTPFGANGQPLAEASPPSPTTYGLASKAWRRPARAPSGACAISATPLPGLAARSGRVVLRLRSFTGLIGRPFLSCVDTQYGLNGSMLDAGVLLDATQPGVAPAALPGMKPVSGHGGVVQAPGWDGKLVGRRTGHAWLLVEGGSSLQQRLTVLEHLRAAVHA